MSQIIIQLMDICINVNKNEINILKCLFLTTLSKCIVSLPVSESELFDSHVDLTELFDLDLDLHLDLDLDIDIGLELVLDLDLDTDLDLELVLDNDLELDLDFLLLNLVFGNFLVCS